MTFLCLSPVCKRECSDCNCAISPVDQLKYAKRYAYLRSRDLDAIEQGGVFAGKTPENLVLNGVDLDEEIDAELSKMEAA